MSLLCLIGRHGSGKSTLGKLLQATGACHYSLGTLFRIAKQNPLVLPRDIPPGVMFALRQHARQTPLAESILRQVIDLAMASGYGVLDGLPAHPDHLRLLPGDTHFAYLYVPEPLRLHRLAERQNRSMRSWSPDRASARDLALPATVLACRATRKLLYFPNGSFEQLHVTCAFYAVHHRLDPGQLHALWRKWG